MIIGLGYRQQSGKDTVAEYLVKNYNFNKIAFAAPIKNICESIYGLNNEQLNGSHKEIHIDRYSNSPRQLFQKIGDALRSIDEKILLFYVENLLEKYIADNKNVVISDVRLLSEANLVKNYGGLLVKVNRVSLIDNKHILENQLATYDRWDAEIDNFQGIEKLYSEIDHLMMRSFL